jgi:hypothetical protein
LWQLTSKRFSKSANGTKVNKKEDMYSLGSLVSTRSLGITEGSLEYRRVPVGPFAEGGLGLAVVHG